MIKSVGKFILRMAKCVIGAVALCFVGYYVSWGLNWFTGTIMNFLSAAANYLVGNYVAIIWVVVALIIGGIAFELAWDSFRSWNAKRVAKKAQKKAQKQAQKQGANQA